MRTQLKLQKLGIAAVVAAAATQYALPVDQAQRKMLAQAVEFELGKTQMALDLLGPRIVTMQKGIHFAGNPARFTAPTIENIKQFLATKFFPAGTKYATVSDNPVLNDVSNEFEQYFHTNMAELDLAWTTLFDLVDLRNSTHDHFDIITTNAGIAWTLVSENGEIKPARQVAEAKSTCTMLQYGAGLGINDQWLEDQKFWNISEAVAEFNASYWDKLASLHYGLFTAQSSAIDVNFATDDTTTYNTACATVLRNIRTSGYAAGSNPGFTIICSPEKVGRILKMLEATQGSLIVGTLSAKEPLAYRVTQVIATTWVASNDTGYYLVLPGRQIKRGIKRDLRLESARDIYKTTTDWIGTTRLNATVADTNLVRRVKYA